MALRPVLFITYNFPPHGGAGVQRSLKFVKYLPEFSWQPLVITATPESNPLQDPSLLSDIPEETSIWHIPGFSITNLLYQSQKYKLDQFIVLLNLLLQIPDPTIFWNKKTYPTIRELIKTRQPEVIYTTSGPYSTHLIGLWIAKNFRIPWFADFRDPWSKNLVIPYLPGYRTINRHLERQVLDGADRVACVSEPWTNDLAKNLGEQSEKFIVLPNGYDDEIKPMQVHSNTNKFTLTHIGSFHRNRRPNGFIEAITIISEQDKILADELRLIFIGKNTQGIIPNRYPFETYSYISHKELDKFRSLTDVFILILDTSPKNTGKYSGKIYEYIASNRPILGIVPKGGVAETLIKQTNTGLTVSNDPAEIARAILELHSKWKSNKLDWHPNWEIIKQYTRRNQTARLAAEFNKLASSRST